MAVKYDKDSIKTLDWYEHIRLRPGMYIGKLGDGQSPDDGIYVLAKEVIDNSIDEFAMGAGRKIPLEKVIDCVSKMNTGGKYDSEAFQKSVGMNGVGTKAVNALSTKFIVQSFRDGKVPPRKTAPKSTSSPITTCSRTSGSSPPTWKRRSGTTPT